MINMSSLWEIYCELEGKPHWLEHRCESLKTEISCKILIDILRCSEIGWNMLTEIDRQEKAQSCKKKKKWKEIDLGFEKQQRRNLLSYSYKHSNICFTNIASMHNVDGIDPRCVATVVISFVSDSVRHFLWHVIYFQTDRSPQDEQRTYSKFGGSLS